jgi:hypothetical protein
VVWFWHDLWCGKQSLKSSFSRLFTIARCKDAWMADHMQFHNGNIHWNIFFTGLVRDWEVEGVSDFL